MQNIVKITTFLNPLNLIAPHSCRGCGSLGKPLCNCCKNYIINSRENYCPNCKAKNKTGNCKNCKDLPKIFIVAERSSLVGKLIYDFKFSSVRALSTPLAELLDQVLPKIPGNVKIVPLPTIAKHVRARGLDHTYLIAKSLSNLRNYKTERLLLRAKNTVQVGASENTRKKQAETAYKLAKNAEIDKEATYILLDDIWTTGASMKAAVKKLRQAGVSKIVIAILAVNRLD